MSTSKIDKTVDRIRIIVKMGDFNRQDRISTIRRYLIVLYLANIHPSFIDAGEMEDDNLRYFSGPKLTYVARRISKEWRMGNNRIKFDRSRIAPSKYKMCKDDSYVKIKIESGKNMLYALTRKGFNHCEEIVNSSYWTASSKNVSKVRVIAFNNYSKKTYFLALKEDSSYVLGTADIDLRHQGITENSLFEYIKKELRIDFGELPFSCRIEHIDNDSLRLLEEDGSIPMIKDMIKTDIKEINAEDKLYYIRGKIVSRWSPDDVEGIKEIEDIESGAVTIQDNTGKISYIKMPYDSGWREETIRLGNQVEAIGIFKPWLKIRDTTITTSLYTPYKVEFFR